MMEIDVSTIKKKQQQQQQRGSKHHLLLLLLAFIEAHESISSRNTGLPLIRLFDNFSSKLIDRYLAEEYDIENKDNVKL